MFYFFTAKQFNVTWKQNVVPEIEKEDITWKQNVVPEIEKEEITYENISDADSSDTTASLILSKQGALYHKRAKLCCVIGFPSNLLEPSDAIRLICEENEIDQPVNVWYYTINRNQVNFSLNSLLLQFSSKFYETWYV